MKKLLLNLLITGAILWIPPENKTLLAQGLTVPDYSYVSVYATSAVVSIDGVTHPGPYGNYSMGERDQPYGIFFGHGYRWWGYPTAPIFICDHLPLFNFPGFHGIYELTGLG